MRRCEKGERTRGHVVSAEQDSTVLTVDEAAALLRVNRKTLYEAIRLGQVPGVIHLGRVVRLVRSTLLSSSWGNAAPALGEKNERKT
jgi:excisionase family DNA binding protein